MYKQVEKSKENKSRAVANSVAQKKGDGRQGFGFLDNRTESIVQGKLQVFSNDNVPQEYNIIQRVIKFEYDEHGRELRDERVVTPGEIWSELIMKHGLPRTNRMMFKLKEFDDKNAIFSDVPELISVLKSHDVPTNTLSSQARGVFLAKSKDSRSNFANAIIIVDIPGGPVFETKISGSGRVGNSAYAFPSTESKKLSRDINQSQNDSEVGLFQEIHKILFQNDSLSPILSEKKTKVHIRIMSNMGPCDGCKKRLLLLKENFIKNLGYDRLTVDVHYASEPGKADNRENSTYGWVGDSEWKSGMKQGLYVHQNAQNK